MRRYTGNIRYITIYKPRAFLSARMYRDTGWGIFPKQATAETEGNASCVSVIRHYSFTLLSPKRTNANFRPAFIWPKIIARKAGDYSAPGRFPRVPAYTCIQSMWYYFSIPRGMLNYRADGGSLMRNRVHWNRVNHPRRWPVAVVKHDQMLSLVVFAHEARAWFLCARMDSALSIMRSGDHLALLRGTTLDYNQITRDK